MNRLSTTDGVRKKKEFIWDKNDRMSRTCAAFIRYISEFK
jgi:hypothetical protein